MDRIPVSSTFRNRRSLILRALAGLVALMVIGFAVWLIHEANIGRDNDLFRLVRRTPYGDKIGHFLLAGLFTLAANFLLRRWTFPVGRIRAPVGSLLVSALVLLEEGSQHFLPTRSFDLLDALANFAGIIVFSLPHIRRKRSEAGASSAVRHRHRDRDHEESGSQ